MSQHKMLIDSLLLYRASTTTFNPMIYSPLEWKLLVTWWFADNKYIRANSQLKHAPDGHVRIRGRDKPNDTWDYGTAYFDKAVCIVNYDSGDNEELNMLRINPELFQFDTESFFGEGPKNELSSVSNVLHESSNPKSLLRAQTAWPILMKNNMNPSRSMVQKMLETQPLLVLPIGQKISYVGGTNGETTTITGTYLEVKWVAQIDLKDLEHNFAFDDDMDDALHLKLTSRDDAVLKFESEEGNGTLTVKLDVASVYLNNQ